MSDVAKPDPAADQTANPGATLVKDETAKVTTDKAADQPETSTSTSTSTPSDIKDDKPITEKATEAAASAAAAVKDNVFSMFGGGPAKVKKEEVDDADEPSGASKPKAADVRYHQQNRTWLC
jgi:Ran-binding protein 1